MEHLIIDAIGPFFRGLERRTINWSKIPFEHLETGHPAARRRQFDQIADDLRTFADRAASTGYNVATLDDLAHLADHPLYEEETRTRIAALREEFRPLIKILDEAGLSTFLTLDVLSYTPALRKEIGTSPTAVRAFLCELIDQFFSDFPEVAGLVMRIGESDGKDVGGLFHSQLVIRTAGEVNALLHDLLLIFKKHDRTLIFRTWTVGAYPVGDLMWNPDTFSEAFADLDPDHLILSLKYGETDFFRHLPLSPLFAEGEHRKIIELQARREYEGAGEFPSFIGADYENYLSELTSAHNVVGIMVWVQTGGWMGFRRTAYLGDGSPWTEINAEVTALLARGQSLNEAVATCAQHRNIDDPRDLLALLTLSHEVVSELPYVDQFAQLPLYFRRLRIPTISGLYWDNLFVNAPLRAVLRHLVTDHRRAARSGWSALEKLDEMRPLAQRCGLPAEDIDFMRDSFHLLALARDYTFLPDPGESSARLAKAIDLYEKTYSQNEGRTFKISAHGGSNRAIEFLITIGLRLMLRLHREYRILDKIFVLRLLPLLYRTFSLTAGRVLLPKFARDSAMGIDTVFK